MEEPSQMFRFGIGGSGVRADFGRVCLILSRDWLDPEWSSSPLRSRRDIEYNAVHTCTHSIYSARHVSKEKATVFSVQPWNQGVMRTILYPRLLAMQMKKPWSEVVYEASKVLHCVWDTNVQSRLKTWLWSFSSVMSLLGIASPMATATLQLFSSGRRL